MALGFLMEEGLVGALPRRSKVLRLLPYGTSTRVLAVAVLLAKLGSFTLPVTLA